MLLKKFAGKGQPINNNVLRGQPGFKERFDAEQHIGYYVDQATGMKTLTTKGMIVYFQKGVHMYPIKP